MSLLKRNIFANFSGQAAATLIAFVTVPFYVRYLGTEGYGLVSFLLSFQALTVILDFGLSTTANREISRYLAQQRSEADRRNLIRTLEVFYYCMGLAIFLGCAVAAPWLARNWFQTKELDAGTLRTCLVVGGGSIALRWPNALYEGILRGIERQVTLNLINCLTALLRGGGTILVLVFVARTVVVFYWWQLFFSLIELGVFGVITWHHSGGFSGSSPRFEWSVLRGLWCFSAKVGGLSLFALVLKQLDKILISNLLPIKQLGFYSTASLAANGLSKVGQPVQVAVFPRLTHLHAKQEYPALAETFHRCCQITAFLSCPCACVLLFFPHDVLWLWTRNAELATQAGPALSILAGAMMLNSMMSVPFSLQLAVGLTWLPLCTNAIGAVTLAPLIYWLVKTQGLVGGAYAWLLFNTFYYLLVPPVMFRWVLNGHYASWVTQDTLPFMVSGLGCFGLARWAVGDGILATKITLMVAALIGYGGLTLGFNAGLRGAVLASPLFRLIKARST